MPGVYPRLRALVKLRGTQGTGGNLTRTVRSMAGRSAHGGTREMTKLEEIGPPPDLDWQHWVDSWDRMQERYLVERNRALRDHRPPDPGDAAFRGSRPGSRLRHGELDVIRAGGVSAEAPGSPVSISTPRYSGCTGEEARLARFGDRSRLLLADMRRASWTAGGTVAAGCGGLGYRAPLARTRINSPSLYRQIAAADASRRDLSERRSRGE